MEFSAEGDRWRVIFIQYASTASVMDYILSAGPFHIEIHLDGLLSQYYFLMKQELIYFVSLDRFRFYFGLCGMVNIQFLMHSGNFLPFFWGGGGLT